MYQNHTSRLDRFCAKHPRFGIPNLMLYVALGNVAIALLDTFSTGGVALSDMLYFDRAAIFSGQVWRLITFILVPENSSLVWAAVAAMFYYWIGSTLEREWGTAKFNVFYFSGVALNVLYGLLVGYSSMYYVDLSLFFAFATLYGEARVMLLFLFPVKVKWLAWLDAALFLWEVGSYLWMGFYWYALLPVLAILNYFLFFRREIGGFLRRKGRQASPKAVKFRTAQKQARKKTEQQGYTHKCAVCGRTDRDDPTLEFRYCSKCDGYHCYCMDHITSHVHIRQ